MSAIYAASSYLLITPAQFIGSRIRYAFGYQSPTEPIRDAASRQLVIDPRGGPISPPLVRNDDMATNDDDEQLRIALELAMENFERVDETAQLTSRREGGSINVQERVKKEEDEEYKELSRSPSSSSSSLPDHLDPLSAPLIDPPAAAPCPIPPSMMMMRRSLDLSTTLSQLNRRATVCLSTLLETAQPVPKETPDDDDDHDEQEKEEEEVESQSGNIELIIKVRQEEGEEVVEVVERVFDERLKPVLNQVEEFVEQVQVEAAVAARDKVTVVEGKKKKDDPSIVEVEGQGWTWFETQTQFKQFDQVEWNEREGTNAEEFCQACEGLVRLAEHLVPALAGICTSDLVAEIRKIRTRSTVEQVTTLEQIISIERPRRRKVATEAINWLLLVLRFGTTAYQMNLASTDEEELSISFIRAWDQEYYQYFNFLVRPLFKILIKACPTRDGFYSKLGSPRRVVERDFGTWLSGIQLVSQRIVEWEEKKHQEEEKKKKKKNKKNGVKV